MKIKTAIFLLVFFSGFVSAAPYFPSPPIGPTHKSECNSYYQHAMTAREPLWAQWERIRAEMTKELHLYLKGQTTIDEYNRLERKARKVYDEHSRLLWLASGNRNDCFIQVRAHEKSVREQNKTSLNTTVNNTVSETYDYHTRAQAKSYLIKKSPDAALVSSAQMTFKKKARQLKIANQAWSLINGKGTWQERLTGVEGISKELNQMRSGGSLSKMLTSGSLSILNKNSHNLMNQLSQSFADFDQVNISHTKNNYVDLMRKGTFAYDTSRSTNESIGEILSAIINRNNPTQHPSQYYSTIINEVQNIMQKQQRQQEQTRITRQQEMNRQQEQARIAKQQEINRRKAQAGREREKRELELQYEREVARERYKNKLREILDGGTSYDGGKPYIDTLTPALELLRRKALEEKESKDGYVDPLWECANRGKNTGYGSPGCR